ncbi:MAG: tRNA1(Val) (adenine(37)-N6)-methyltransferase [Tenericutes bacterium]|jgi:tRNA1(Val) A37 N6-methylase TrmN6|nr:tRNA1(Val) (adenine(37)-N6)-methyltransferase [Mycoplasmatota bacterium]
MSQVYTHDLLAYDGLKIKQTDGLFKFSIDSLLLGDFVRINPRTKKIIDLGCGLGPVSFYLSLKTKAHITGVDIQEDVIELAKESMKINHLEDQITFIHEDIKKVYQQFQTNQFDIVVCNPPFYKTTERNQQNDLESLQIARHEVLLNLEELFSATKRLLSNGGMFYFIHRVERMDEIILELYKQNFVVKRLRFVYTKPNKPAKMLLVEARFNGSMGSLEIEEPLYIYDENTEYTKDILDIFHLGDENYENH